VKKALETAKEQFGRVDVAVSCAGIGIAAVTYNRNKDHVHELEDFMKVVHVCFTRSLMRPMTLSDVDDLLSFISDIAVFVLKRDVKFPTNQLIVIKCQMWDNKRSTNHNMAAQCYCSGLSQPSVFSGIVK